MIKAIKERDIKIVLDDLHPAQQIISDERRRFNVLSCGRRWGKTHFTYRLLAEIIRHNLNQGISEDMGYMSPTYKNLLPTWIRFLKTFESIITYKSEKDYTAEIMNSFRVEFWSLEKPENIRGRQYKRIIVDEAALIAALIPIWKLILLPTIGDLVGDAWFFSTPRGFNDFNKLYEYGQNALMPRWASWIMPTSTNPYFPQEELEEQRLLLHPDEFAQEWEGKFVALGNSPFDTTKFRKVKNIAEALEEDEKILYRVRYWDIADSEDGDYTASSKMSITDKPQFITSDPVRFKGKWGTNYQAIKRILLSEPEVLHVFETEGVGGIAWQMIQMDVDLASVNKLPAGRIFTKENKYDRAQMWAIELNNGRMTIVEDFGYQDLLDEVAVFPFGDNDDYVDGISGNILAFIIFFGGYTKLLNSKIIKPKTNRPAHYYDKMDLIQTLQDVM